MHKPPDLPGLHLRLGGPDAPAATNRPLHPAPRRLLRPLRGRVAALGGTIGLLLAAIIVLMVYRP